jgi:uncharacterized cupredoxin-like copper-binding protein
MGKAILFLVVVFVAGMGVVIYKATRAVSKPTAVNTSENANIDGEDLSGMNLSRELNAAGAEIRDKAAKTVDGVNTGEIKDKTVKTVKTAEKVAEKVAAAVKAPPLTLKLDRLAVELKEGGTAELKATRSGGDMKELMLELRLPTDSNITAGGGTFKANETEAKIVITAQPGAKNSSLTIKAGNVTRLVAVRIVK